MTPYCWFDYKTVIVSGASSGIGKGLVTKLIGEHCCTVIGIGRSEAKMQKLVAELGDNARRFSYYLFDVSVKENWVQFEADLRNAGIRPDLLINNAGILPKFDKFTNYTLEDINHAMQVNFYSSVYSMNALMPLIMESQTPGIVNIASSAALCSLAGTSIYSASKAALKSLTESIREECRGQCYIGLVCPGFTKTDIFANQNTGNESDLSERALQMVSTSCARMVNDIIKGIWKRRSNMVFGIDARLMNNTGKVFGVLIPWASSKVIKMAHLAMFSDVFDEEDEGDPTSAVVREKFKQHIPGRHRMG
ncbi:MAG: SDR family NAD(P)-dependent oxidoreductase [Clostridia bacterium]|nr:SDR family NAD(P)-dependent oxidoreductase [Clostridia bacterium]